jgi:hypothetical protein
MKETGLKFVPETMHTSIVFAGQTTYRIRVTKAASNREGSLEVTEYVLSAESDDADQVLAHFDDILSAELYANEHYAENR